jgi:peptide/nickel transport system substrate-binding protein
VVAQSLDDLTSLDPAEGFELSSVQAFTSLYQRLVQPDRDDPTHLTPVLAARWGPGPEERSVIVELDPQARFSSGRPVRAADVVFSLRRAVLLNRAPAFMLNELGWTEATVDRQVQPLDEHRVLLRWSSDVGVALVLNVLTAPVASIVDASEVQSHASADDEGNGWLRTHAAGSGPFILRRYTPREVLVLDANASAPGGAPQLKTLIVKNVPDAATRRLLLETGDIDLARDLNPDQIAALREERNVQILEFPSAAIHYLLFNTSQSANPALANPALWEAARWSIDYELIADKLLRGDYLVHQSFLAAGFPGSLEATPYHLDIARARSILAKAGLGIGLKIKIKLTIFNQPPYGDIAQSLQATFAQAGIELDIEPAVASEVYSRVRARTEEAVWLYWIPDYFDANSTAAAFALNPEDGTTTLAWRAGWHIPQLSALTRLAARESDLEKRTTLYRQIQDEVQRASPFVIALQAKSVIAAGASVRGYFQGLDADMAYYDRVTR